MDTRLHLHVTAGFAVLSIGAAVAVPAVSPAVARPVESDAVALIAQTQPLSPTLTVTTLSPPGLIGQQVAFHVVFVTDFLSTGALLFARELPIPLTLVADLGGGTPLPTAVARALQDFAAVEVDAGNELLRFGAEYVGFQAQFVANLIPSPAAVTPTATPTTVALTHRSKPRDEASPPVPSKPERPVDTDESERGSSGVTTDVDCKDDSRDSHTPRRDRPDRRTAEGPSAKGSDAQTTRHDGPDRHDRKPDGNRGRHD